MSLQVSYREKHTNGISATTKAVILVSRTNERSGEAIERS